MSHLPILIQDLAVILIVAAVTTLLFKRLNQPVVLGYLLAGVLAGPNLFGHNWIGDLESIKIWGEIGVIFLLFSLGLEFSIRKLIRLGPSSFIGATVILIGMMSSGFTVGKLMGWNNMNALFLGSMLSMSSTTIVFKALDDMGLRQKQFSQVVLGVLIVEDLFAIMLMVLLSTVAVSTDFAGEELVFMLGKLVGFILVFFVGGILIVPSLMKLLKRYLNDETMLVLALGMCLGMVLLAADVGFSTALGAFVMGSLFAETLEGERIERLVKPVKDLFAAVFFVSVGMLINPAMFAIHWVPIVAITLTVVLGQLIFATTGILLSGQPLRVAIQSGFTLTQIGEFAYILAGLGISLGVTETFLYPVVVAVSVLTTFTTPLMIRLAPPVSDFIEKHMGDRARFLLDHYRGGGPRIINQQSQWKPLIRKIATMVLIYGVVAWVVITVFIFYITPLIKLYMPDTLASVISLVILLVVLSPLLYAIMMKYNDSKEFLALWDSNRFNRGSLISIVAFRLVFGVVTMMYVVSHLFTLTIGVVFAIAVFVIIVYVTSKNLKHHTEKLEEQFIRNFRAREHEKDLRAPVRKELKRRLLEHDIHLANFLIPPTANCVGKTLKKLHFRQLFGVNIVRIIRGEEVINVPTAYDKIYPHDHIVVAGTDSQITHFSAFLEDKQRPSEKMRWEYPDVSLEKFIVEPGSFLIDKSIKQLHFQQRATSLIVRVERGGQVVLSFDSSLVFLAGDLVWAVGVKCELRDLLKKMNNNQST